MTGVSLTFAGRERAADVPVGVTEHADDGMRLIQGSCGLPSNLLGFLLDKRSLIPQFGGQHLPRLMWVRRIGKLDERPCLALQGTGVQGDEDKE